MGNGRIPHSSQDRNVVLNIFRIPGEPGFMEKVVQDFTHAHFPQDRFGEVMVQGRYAFGRTGDTYAAFIARYPLYFPEGSSDDLIQPGRDGYWIFEAGSRDSDTNFDSFRQRILSNGVEFDGETLRYHSAGRELSLVYKGNFQIDGQTQDLSCPRFASPYAVAQRKPDTISIAHAGEALYLDFHGQRRELGQTGDPR